MKGVITASPWAGSGGDFHTVIEHDIDPPRVDSGFRQEFPQRTPIPPNISGDGHISTARESALSDRKPRDSA